MQFIFHWWNSLVCFVASISLNTLLIWCIRNHTRKEMRAYSRLLMITCILDCVLSAFDFLTTTVAGKSNEFRYYTFNGSLGNFLVSYGPFDEKYYCLAYLFVAFYSPNWSTVQFFMRYLMVCRQKQFSTTLCIALMLMLCGSLMVVIVDLFILNDESEFGNTPLRMYAAGMMGVQPENVRFCLVLRTSRSLFQVNGTYFSANTYVLFFITCFCAWRILRFSWRGINAKSIGRQISLTLTIQATLPFIVMITTIIPFILPSLRNLYPGFIDWFYTFTTVPYAWLPVLDPLITLLIVRSYREKSYGAIMRFAVKTSDQSSIMKNKVAPHDGGNNITTISAASRLFQARK